MLSQITATLIVTKTGLHIYDLSIPAFDLLESLYQTGSATIELSVDGMLSLDFLKLSHQLKSLRCNLSLARIAGANRST